MPNISIIIPTYNRAIFLKKTLESIFAQTYRDYEIIVIDDGSPNDEAKEVCELFEKVTYLKIENSGGPAKPRNIGIQKAKGNYIAFVDDDDIWLPNKLQVQVAVMDANPDFGLVHGCCEIINEDGVLQNRIIGRPGTPDVKHGDVSMRMMGNWTVMMPTSFIRKEIVDQVGFFNETMPPAGEDTEYWTRCSFFTNFYYIDEPLVEYRVHSNNISTEATGYADLSLYLKKSLLEFKEKKMITSTQFEFLLNNLCRMQLKMIKKYTSRSLCNLFSLNPFWMFKWSNLKLLSFILLKR